MTDRAKVIEAVQIGLETTPGTAVAAGTNIRSVSVDTKIGGQADLFRPDGHKFNTLAEQNMDWSTFALNGKPTYTEILWFLAMMFGNSAPVVTGTAINTRDYDMLDTTLLAPKTATIMKGSATRAQKFAFAALTDLGLTFSRSGGVSLTGSGIGALFTDGITLTSSPADVPLKTIMGKHLDFYIDASAAALGTTKMLRAFHVEPSIAGVFGPIWAINSATTSYGGLIDLAPTATVKIVLEADAAGMAYLTQYRAGSTIFARLDATGDVFESAQPYKFQYDSALLVKTVSPDEDESGVTTVTYECEMTKDSTWGKALHIKSISDVATVA